MGDLRDARVSRLLSHRSDHEPFRTNDLGMDRASSTAVSHSLLLAFLELRLEDSGLLLRNSSARHRLSAIQQRGRHVFYLWRLVSGLPVEAEPGLSSHRRRSAC